MATAAAKARPADITKLEESEAAPAPASKGRGFGGGKRPDLDEAAGPTPPPTLVRPARKPRPMPAAAASAAGDTGRMAPRAGPGSVKQKKEAKLSGRKNDHARGRWTKRPPVQMVCSDVARRPLAQRLVLWRKRLRTAGSPGALLQRYESARRSCELNDWRQEQLFLRLLQQRVNSRGGVNVVLRHFAGRPQVQRFIARLFMRRTVDTEIVLEVQRVLFGSAVDWDTVDRRLSEIEDPAARLSKLRDYVAREPEDPRGQIRLVQLLAASDQLEQALAVGRRLRDRGLLTLPIARQLGDVLARAQLKQEAVRTYSEIVEFDPNNPGSRLLLGDIYLGHGWYEPAYRQYRSVADAAPDDPLAWLRLASAAAGSGRVDEALRLERRVATAQGRPGPNDPRRWARLWSAARIARLIAEPPKSNAPSRASLERKLKELQLFGGGSGSLIIATWEDLRNDFQLTTEVDDVPMALGDITDAASSGLAAVSLSETQRSRAKLMASLRSVPGRDAVTIIGHTINWNGKKFEVALTRKQLPARDTRIEL